jgi:hypothetical protein
MLLFFVRFKRIKQNSTISLLVEDKSFHDFLGDAKKRRKFTFSLADTMASSSSRKIEI